MHNFFDHLAFFRGQYNVAFIKFVKNHIRTLHRIHLMRLQSHFRILRCFIWCIEAGKIRYFAISCFAVQSLGITFFAFRAKNERSRIEILTILYGISWPSASVIIHFCHSDPYPIIDYRSLWTVGLEVPNVYHFELWWCYTESCREIAQRNHVDMRTLDRALWQYSKENQ